MWHYSLKGTENGPVDLMTLKTLLTDGVINTETLVWKEGMENWVALSSVPELTTVLPPSLIPDPTGQHAGYSSKFLPKRSTINSLFCWYFILYGISILLTFLNRFDPQLGGVFGGLGTLISYVSWVFFYIFMYKCWKTVPKNIARTTPGKAVGFCFIPLFNFYWIFVAICGLAKDLNSALAQKGIQPIASFGITLFLVLWQLIGGVVIGFYVGYSTMEYYPNPMPNLQFITDVGMALGVVTFILSLIVWSKIKNAACALLEK